MLEAMKEPEEKEPEVMPNLESPSKSEALKEQLSEAVQQQQQLTEKNNELELSLKMAQTETKRL